MDAQSEVLEARHYAEGLQALCNGEEAMPLTGFQLLLLLHPLVDRLKRAEAILTAQA